MVCLEQDFSAWANPTEVNPFLKKESDDKIRPAA